MTLNDLIVNTRDWDQHAAILSAYLETEVFFELANVPATQKDGHYTVTASDEIRIRPVHTQGWTMALFCTTMDNFHIQTGRVGGMSLKAAIEMVMKSSGLQGILLQSDRADWVAFKKESLAVLMNA